MSRRREDQDAMDKVILKKLSANNIHWSDLLKIVLTTCRDFCTFGRFNSRMRYLLKKGYIERLSRGVYGITEKGKKYMEII